MTHTSLKPTRPLFYGLHTDSLCMNRLWRFLDLEKNFKVPSSSLPLLPQKFSLCFQSIVFLFYVMVWLSALSASLCIKVNILFYIIYYYINTSYLFLIKKHIILKATVSDLQKSSSIVIDPLLPFIVIWSRERHRYSRPNNIGIENNEALQPSNLTVNCVFSLFLFLSLATEHSTIFPF